MIDKISLFFALSLTASTTVLAEDISIENGKSHIDTPVLKVDEKGINNSQEVPREFTFMEVHVIDHGKTANEKFFIGPLPKVGQSVEMIYTGDERDGSMKFQLRVKP